MIDVLLRLDWVQTLFFLGPHEGEDEQLHKFECACLKDIEGRLGNNSKIGGI